MTLASKLQEIATHVALDPRDKAPKLTLQSKLGYVSRPPTVGEIVSRRCPVDASPEEIRTFTEIVRTDYQTEEGRARWVPPKDEVLFILTCWGCSDRGCASTWSFTENDMAGDPIGLVLLNSPGRWQNIMDRLEATPAREKPTSWAWLLSDDCS